MSRKLEKMRDAGYEYVRFIPSQGHVLRDLTTGRLEVWFSNKNHASYGIIYKNTHLEYARDFRP